MDEISVEQVDEWLAAKPHTLWAAWDISHDDRRRLAAEWFVTQQRSLGEYLATIVDVRE